MSIVGPHPWDWEVGQAELRGWAGYDWLLAFEIANLYDQPDPALQVMCPVCGRRVAGYRDLKLRWDGVMVCKDDWDPRPRNYRRRRVFPERPRNLRSPGGLTFLDDGEGRT